MDPLLQGPQYEPRPDVHSTGVGEAALALECEFFKVPVTYGHELGLSDRRCWGLRVESFSFKVPGT